MISTTLQDFPFRTLNLNPTKDVLVANAMTVLGREGSFCVVRKLNPL